MPGVPPKTRHEYIHVGSLKTSMFFKVLGGTPNTRRIVQVWKFRGFEYLFYELPAWALGKLRCKTSQPQNAEAREPLMTPILTAKT